MDEQSPQAQLVAWWRDLEPERRVAVGMVAVCGILTLGLSLAYLRSHVVGPFLVPKAVLEKNVVTNSSDQAAQDRLRATDTDHDGLSDYDEQNVYKTSPYLPDTDSDGISDGREVALHSDPNCPQGQACNTSPDTLSFTATSTGGLNGSFVAPLAPTSPATGTPATIQVPPSPDALTPAQMRTYFLQSGLMDPAKLQSLPDDGVVQVYRATYDEAVRIQAAGSIPAAPTSP